VRFSTDGTHCALKVELGKLDKVKLRVVVLTRLPRLADRRRFEREAPEDASHAQLVEAGAAALTRAALLESYAPDAGDRVSGERPTGAVLARIALVKQAAGG